MEPIAGAVPGSGLPGPELETLQFGEEIQRLMALPPPQRENASSFTALLELPPTQAMELLHLTPPEPPLPAGGVMFPDDAALIQRAAKFSVFGAENDDAGGALKVKSEPAETNSNPNSSSMENSNGNRRSSAKRKEREKKGKVTSAKKGKTEEVKEDPDKLPYVHVRARRGQATDSHSLAERARREKINARMKLLQELVPGCNKHFLYSISY